MRYIFSRLFIIGLFVFYSCHDGTLESIESDDRLYVTLQSANKIAILNASTLEVLEEIETGMMTTPHYVILDEENGYWFTSLIGMQGNKILMYSIDTNELISTLPVDEDPAILSIDTHSKTLYSSRMMIMQMDGMPMGSAASLIDEISYDDNGMILLQTIDATIPTPHGLALSEDKTTLLTASNTTDHLSVINLSTNNSSVVSLDSEINTIPTLEVQRLNPLEIVEMDGYAFITCTGGEWYNNGNPINVNGQVQVWNTETLEKVATFEFDVYSKPWHIELDPFENKVYVALSGDSSIPNSAGVACLSFNGTDLNQVWKNTNDIPNDASLHGITISGDGQYIYVSGRGDGYIYKIDANTGDFISLSTQLVDNGMMRTGGIAITNQP